MVESISSAIAAGLAKSARDEKLKRKQEAELQAAVLPVDMTGSRPMSRGLLWFVAVGDAGSNLIDFGPLAFEPIESADSSLPQLPDLPEGVAQVEGVAEFSSAKATLPAVHRGAWFYEVEVLTGGLAQLGWAHTSFDECAEADDGVTRLSFSFSVCPAYSPSLADWR